MGVTKSFQTRELPRFQYNPFASADIYLFPADRPLNMPRQFILFPDILESRECGYPVAYACNGKIRVSLDYATRQITVTVNGKKTNRYSIKYANNKKRKPFAAY